MEDGRTKVTGATGTVGRQVVDALRTRRASVRALVEHAVEIPREFGASVAVVRGDYDDLGSLERAVAGVERVFLLTPPDPRQVQWQQHVIDAAAWAGVRHIVKLSAYRSEPDSPFAIARWHAAGEARLRSSGLAYTCLQPQVFMQNLLRQAPAVRDEGIVRGLAGTVQIGMVDARDVAEVAAAALLTDAHFGRTYVPTGGQAISYAEVSARLGAALGKPIRYVELDPDVLRQTLRDQGVPEWRIESQVDLAQILTAEVTTHVREVTKHAPRTVDQFIQDHITHFG